MSSFKVFIHSHFWQLKPFTHLRVSAISYSHGMYILHELYSQQQTIHLFIVYIANCWQNMHAWSPLLHPTSFCILTLLIHVQQNIFHASWHYWFAFTEHSPCIIPEWIICLMCSSFSFHFGCSEEEESHFLSWDLHHWEDRESASFTWEWHFSYELGVLWLYG